MPSVKGKTDGLKSSEFLVTVCGLILGLGMAIAEQVLGDGCLLYTSDAADE